MSHHHPSTVAASFFFEPLLSIFLHEIVLPKAWNLHSPVRHYCCCCVCGFADRNKSYRLLEFWNADEAQEEICVIVFASMKNILFSFLKQPSDRVARSLTEHTFLAICCRICYSMPTVDALKNCEEIRNSKPWRSWDLDDLRSIASLLKSSFISC